MKLTQHHLPTKSRSRKSAAFYEKQSRLQPPEPRHLLRSPAYLSPAFRGVYQRRLRQGAVRQHQESLQHLDLHGLPGGQEGLYHQLFL